MKLPKQQKPIVLVADDNPIVLQATVAMFSELGCEVLKANDAKEVMTIVREINLMRKALAMAVFDIEFEGENGDQLAKRVHKVFPALQIFGFTAMSKDSMKKVDQSELNGLFQKPLTTGICQKLLNDVRKVC